MVSILITYTGRIYDNRQNPEILFKGLRMFLDSVSLPDGYIGVDLYGEAYPWVDKLIKKYGLEDVVKQRGWVSYDESLKLQRETTWLWALNWEDEKESNITTGKVFEYLGAAKRPIVVTGGYKSTLTDIVKKTNRGVWCPDENAVLRWLIGSI